MKQEALWIQRFVMDRFVRGISIYFFLINEMIINIENFYKLLLHFIHGFALNKGNIHVCKHCPSTLFKKKLSIVFIKHMKILSRKYVLVHIWNQRLILACTTLLVLKKVFSSKYTLTQFLIIHKSSFMFNFGPPRLAQHTFGGIQLWNSNFISISMSNGNCISNQKIFAGYG